MFVISMLSLSASGTYLAIRKPDLGSILGGVLTFYMVATAWATARHKVGETGIFDYSALLVALAIAGSQLTFGVEAGRSMAGSKAGYPAALYFIFGSVALLAAAGDIRMLARGVSGAQRLTRHLWRMNFAWFVASASIFGARPQLFPSVMRTTGVLFLLSILPLILMTVWLVRVLLTKAYKRTAPAAPAHDAPRTPVKARPAAAVFVLTLAMGAGVFSVAMAARLSGKSIADTLSATIASSGIDQATRQYHDLKTTAPAAYNFAENELNSLGYELIRAKKFEEAIRIFQLNVEAYPQ
jgi:hypothetical protein